MSKTKNTKNQAKAVKRQKHTVVVLTYKKFSFMYRIMFCKYAKKNIEKAIIITSTITFSDCNKNVSNFDDYELRT